ncbi:GNAT family N-acetyltransferase [Saccharopolyspora sp. NPDC002578]
MTAGGGNAAEPTGVRGRATWTREMVELAALCAVAGIVHLIGAGPRSADPAAWALVAFGALLVAGAAVRSTRPRGAGHPAAEPVAERGPDAELVSGGRALWRLRASVSDSPGRLADVASGLAGLGGDIRTLHVHPVADGAVDDVLVHVPATVGETDLVRAVAAAGGRDVTARRAEVRELDDVPTRTLNLAANLVDGRGDVERALRGTLGEIEVRWQEEPHPAAGLDGVADGVICLAAPGGGALVLERTGAAFTPAEFARARAMAGLAAACRRRLRPEVRELTSNDGARLTVRAADREDLDLVTEFHARCSSAARYRRYCGASPPDGEHMLRLLTPALGGSLLVQGPDGAVVAVGNLVREGRVAEVALLVRDDWQRRGIGTRLAAELVEQARAAGLDTVQAHTHVDDTAIARTLRAAGLKLVGVPEPGEWSWSRSLTGAR